MARSPLGLLVGGQLSIRFPIQPSLDFSNSLRYWEASFLLGSQVPSQVFIRSRFLFQLMLIPRRALYFLKVSIGSAFVIPSANISEPGIHLTISSPSLTSSRMW